MCNTADGKLKMLIPFGKPQGSDDPVAIQLIAHHSETLCSYFKPIFYVEPTPPPAYIRFLRAWIIFSDLDLPYYITTPDVLAQLVGLTPHYAHFRPGPLEHIFSDDWSRRRARTFLLKGTVVKTMHWDDLASRCIESVYVALVSDKNKN